jgi:hypothetical protein
MSAMIFGVPFGMRVGVVLLLTSSRPSLPHDPSPQENTWFLSVDARLCLCVQELTTISHLAQMGEDRS